MTTIIKTAFKVLRETELVCVLNVAVLKIAKHFTL